MDIEEAYRLVGKPYSLNEPYTSSPGMLTVVATPPFTFSCSEAVDLSIPRDLAAQCLEFLEVKLKKLEYNSKHIVHARKVIPERSCKNTIQVLNNLTQMNLPVLLRKTANDKSAKAFAAAIRPIIREHLLSPRSVEADFDADPRFGDRGVYKDIRVCPGEYLPQWRERFFAQPASLKLLDAICQTETAQIAVKKHSAELARKAELEKRDTDLLKAKQLKEYQRKKTRALADEQFTREKQNEERRHYEQSLTDKENMHKLALEKEITRRKELDLKIAALEQNASELDREEMREMLAELRSFAASQDQ